MHGKKRKPTTITHVTRTIQHDKLVKNNGVTTVYIIMKQSTSMDPYMYT